MLRSSADAENRGIRDGDMVSWRAAPAIRHCAPGFPSACSRASSIPFHHVGTGANVVTTDYSDWATNCPEYKVTAVDVRLSNRPSEWQESYAKLREATRRIAVTAAE